MFPNQNLVFRLNGKALLIVVIGLLTPFSIQLGGNLPLAEVFMLLVLGILIINVCIRRRLPAPWRESPYFFLLLASMAVTFAAYIMSDLYWQSNMSDMLRGWSRIIFLTIDILVIRYLVYDDVKQILLFSISLAIGLIARVLLFGALFDDYWKFGFGGPVTLLTLSALSYLSIPIAVPGIFLLSIVHTLAGYRAMALNCLLVCASRVTCMLPKRMRIAFICAGAFSVMHSWLAFYTYTSNEKEVARSGRSNVERVAMIKACWYAFLESPILGNGSWFGKSDVWDDFLLIRREDAERSGVGGFDHRSHGSTMIHSQLLTSLAEAGIFGGTFFIVYGFLLVSSFFLCFLKKIPCRPLVFSLLLGGMVTLMFSTLSGSSRIRLAVASSLVLTVLNPKIRHSVNQGIARQDIIEADNGH